MLVGGRHRQRRLASAAVGGALALAAGLATAGTSFEVNSSSDAVDVRIGDRECRTSAGTCTLRAAIQEANALDGQDTILIPAGTYALAIPPLNQNLADNGDLDITDSVIIRGAGAGATIVDGGQPPAGSPPDMRGLDRLFEVLVDEGTVTFSNLTFSDGYAAEWGGAVINSSTATVNVTASILIGNVAGKTGGAIENHVAGTVNVTDSTLSRNLAFEGGSAANNNRGGTLTLANTTVSDNSASAIGLNETLVGAGAISNNAELDAHGSITVAASRILDNTAGGGRSGAGISNDGAGTLTVDATSFSKNRTTGDGGAIFNGAGVVSVTDSTFSENAAKDGGAIASTGGVLTVIDSSFSKNRAEDWGGGILNSNQGSAVIANGSFIENSAITGGGFANEGTGLVTVENATFTKNTAIASAVLASGEGGGMHSNSGGEVVITGGTFTENTARSGGGFSNEGGGIVAITGTRFAGNRAEEQGGGILVQGGAVRMVDIDVVGNVAESVLEGGGGISYAGDKSAAIGESAAIENSRIRDNKSGGDGGGVDSRGDGPLAITTTSITGNTAASGGGIHHVGDAPLQVTLSTLSGNFAEGGGGIFTDGDGEATIENTTITGNRAGQFGGGLLVSSRLTIRSSTVAGNTAASGGGINNGGGDLIGDGSVFLANTIVANSPTGGNCAGTMTSRGGNLDSGNSCQLTELTDQPGTDPRLGSLADNGGPTHTLALLAGSPAQESAACTDIDPCPPVDQRGIARPIFDGVDTGAYESALTLGEGGEATPCTGLTERPVRTDFDSWVSQSAPGANFGGDSILRVDAQAGGNEHALVHFALPPVPPGCRLVDATLRLHSSAAIDGRTLEALRVSSEWSEFGITWANEPATAGPPATTLSGLDWREWDVLAQTLDMYTLGQHGFLIRDAAGIGIGEQSFHSREKMDRSPELVLVFDDPDAPPLQGTCPTTAQTLAADSDSWVSEGSPSNNFGTDSTLKVKSQGSSNSRALVRFPLPTLPAGCTSIASAVLHLDATSAKDGRTLEARQIAAPWSENGVTWGNQPAAIGLAAATPSAQGVLEWVVTAQVLEMYASANHGFLIRDADEDGVGDEQTLNSRHKVADGPPELVLIFDDTMPETTLDPGPVSPTDQAGATFTFFSDRTDATFECALDGASFRGCTSPHLLAGLSEGDHTFEVRSTREVRAVDPTPASHEWTIAVPPETTISGPASPSVRAVAVLAFSADDDSATFECALNEAPFEACTSPIEYTDLEDGDNEVLVRATDPLGNVEPVPASHAWTVAVPPETTITNQPTDPTNTTAASFAFSGSDNGTAADELVFECRLDSADPADFGPCPVEYSNLGAGAHAFEVRATDLAGNTDASPAAYTWTIDLTPPEVTIGEGPADPANQTSASFTFSGTDDHTAPEALSFACRVDDAAAGFGACLTEYPDLAEGAHTFEVHATDAAGNLGTPASHRWTIDLTPPATAISGPDDPTRDTNARFEFAADEPATLACALDDGPVVGCTSPVEHSDLREGAHTFEVRATDLAGNTDASPASYTWTIDLSAPTTMIGDAPDDPTNTTAASFSFTGSDNTSDPEALAFECSLDSAAFTTCTSPASYAGLAEALHTFRVRASDAAGNTDASPAIHEWTIDTTAPDTTIDGGPTAVTNETSATFDLAADELGVTFACALDAADYVPCPASSTYLGLAEGSHTFAARATDTAGNVDGSPAAHTWTIDTTPPDTTLEARPVDPTNRAAATFTFTSTEPGSFACALDEATFAPCASPTSYADLAAGAHVFRVRATDTAANPDPSAATHTWTIDTTPPDTTLGDWPVSPTNSTGAVFSFTADEDAAFTCSLDGAAFGPCTSPTAYADLPEGRHTFAVRATDAAGNGDVSPADHGWTIDTTPPETAISSGPSTITNQTDATFLFTSDESSSFACSLDGVAFTLCAPETRYIVDEGAHALAVRATDLAGNTDASPAGHAWTVDLTPPDTTLGDRPADPTTSTEATFTFSATESAAFACSLDGAAFSTCTPPASYTDLSEAPHTFAVHATDAAGNTDASPAAFGWTIDITPPETSIASGPGALTNQTSATFDLGADEPGATFTCSLDGATLASCASPVGYAGLAEGRHTLVVEASDTVGNTDASPAIHEWTIDTTAPETTIGEHPADHTSSATASFTFSGSEPGSFACALDEATFAPCASPTSYADLAAGAHVFRVRATDTAANPDPSAATHTWTIDTTPPDTTIDGGPDDPTTSTDATFAFSATGSATFECSLDGAAFSTCTSPAAYSDLSEAPHTFAVRATDTAGNTDASPAAFDWIVERPADTTPPDTTPPDTTIDSGPSGPSNSTGATFEFSPSEPGSTFECSLDTGAFVDCSSPRAYTGLATGAHQFRVRAVDPAGNVDASPASLSWTVDTTAPNTTITAGPAQGSTTTTTSASFSFTSTEASSTFQCSLDSTSAYSPCSSPRQYTALTIGNHTFRVRAVDAAGNVDGSPASRAWTIQGDTTAPDTTITAGPAQGSTTTTTSASFSFTSTEAGSTFQCSLDTGSFLPCTSPKAYTDLTSGAHTFRVRAIDAAGNTDASPASRNWAVEVVSGCGAPLTLASDGDAWIEQNSPSSNRGADSILKVKSQGPTDNFRTLARFAIPTEVPAGCVIESATLRLWAASATSGRTLEARSLATTWTENGVTWGNQPLTTGTAATTSSGSGYRDWEVTSQVRAMSDTGANHGFLIRDATESGSGAEQSFHAREKGENGPQLVITFAEETSGHPDALTTASGGDSPAPARQRPLL